MNKLVNPLELSDGIIRSFTDNPEILARYAAGFVPFISISREDLKTGLNPKGTLEFKTFGDMRLMNVNSEIFSPAVRDFLSCNCENGCLKIDLVAQREGYHTIYVKYANTNHANLNQ